MPATTITSTVSASATVVAITPAATVEATHPPRSPDRPTMAVLLFTPYKIVEPTPSRRTKLKRKSLEYVNPGSFF